MVISIQWIPLASFKLLYIIDIADNVHKIKI